MEELLMNLYFVVEGILMILFMGYCTYKVMKNKILEIGGQIK